MPRLFLTVIHSAYSHYDLLLCCHVSSDPLVIITTAQNFLSEFASLISASSANEDQVTMLFGAALDVAHDQIRMMSMSSPPSLSEYSSLDDTIGGVVPQNRGEEVLSRLIDDILTN